MDCHSSGKNLLFYLFIKKLIKVTVVVTEVYHCYHLCTVLFNILLSRLTPYIDETIEIFSEDFEIIDKLLIRCFALISLLSSGYQVLFPWR
jgi:hypothetical protein